MTSDYAGILSGKDTYCLSKNYNVFFYPYPFVANTVDALSYKEILIYFTQRDLKLINLVSPSKFSRGDRILKRGGIISCDKLPVECGVTGFEYDACIDYSKAPEDIVGMVAIARQDASKLTDKKYEYQPYFNKYFTTFKDARGVIGVPEIILHPRYVTTERTERIPDFSKWYESNKKDFNYLFLHKVLNDNTSLEDTMMALTSAAGLVVNGKTYHAKINKRTNFFQLVEASDAFPVAEMGLGVKYKESKLTRKHLLKTESSVGLIKEEETLDPRMIEIHYSWGAHQSGGEYIQASISTKYYPMFEKFFDIYTEGSTTIIRYNKKSYALEYTGSRESDEEYLPRTASVFDWLTGKDVDLWNRDRIERLIQKAKRNITLMTLNPPYSHDYKMVGFVNSIFRKYLAKGGTRRRLPK